MRAYQTPSGTILVEEETPTETPEKAVIYARVSSPDQREDLHRQVDRLKAFASASGITVSRVVTEIGSGINGRRSKFLALLSDPSVRCILVEHKDRVARFGFEMVEAALKASGRRIIVVDETELTDDLVSDMIDLLTSFCARLYGKRSARNRARKALEAMQE